MLLVPCLPQLGGRLLKYSYHIARVSSWIEHRMRAAITKTMVRPAVGMDQALAASGDVS